MAYKKKYSPEEKAVYKEQKQSEIDEMLKRIDEGVKAVFNSNQYREYRTVEACLERNSVGC